MAVDYKIFSGAMNSDDRPESILQGQHISASNLRFYGGANGLSAQNVKGNYLIANSSLPVGSNECIGSFYDSVNRRIIWFNYNSNGLNGIYQLVIETGLVTPIFICGTNSTTNIFNFNLNYPVHSAALVYRPEVDGDLLYWTDGLNRPRYLNISTVATQSPFTESMINAAKDAPQIPCNRVAGGYDLNYGSDNTFLANNLNKKLFRFSYRWVYRNLEKSSLAPISSVAVPILGGNPNTITINNFISVPVIGGGDDYKAIEILGQESLGNVWDDFFLIDTLDRDEYSINPDTVYTYRFYNNGSFPTINPEDVDLYFSWLPDKANTLELLNGNVLIYSGITEGYDKIPREDIDVVIGSGLATGGLAFTKTSDFSYMIFVTSVQSGATYNIQFAYSSGAGGDASPKNVNYVALPGDTIPDVAQALAALLIGNNITTTYLGGGIFSVETTTGSGTITGLTVATTGTSVSSADNTARWDWSSGQRFALLYKDERGKPIDIISFVSDDDLDATDFSVTTPDFAVTAGVPSFPIITALINHLPPQNAASFQWLRASLTPPPLYYVSSDYQDPGDGFLYFGLQNFLNQKIKDTGFIPSYEFSPGDRMKVLATSAFGGGTTTFALYNIQYDFEILGTVERTMSIPAELGKFLKVKKPDPFGIPAYSGGSLIKIYTPLQKSAEGADSQQLFFEWGQEYEFQEILGIKYHIGNVTNQTASQPASYQWVTGDMYYVIRNYYILPNSTSTVSGTFLSPRYSEYFESSVNANSRGWVLDPNARETYNGVLSRWGGAYQSGTNINELNKFRPTDFDEADRSKGDIRRLKARDRILRVFQDRGVGQYGIYARFIQNNQGVPELVTTNEIITTNNIQYYQGTYGLSGYATNLCSSPLADYFNDVITGREVRLSGDGITDLGLLYKGQFTFPQLVTPYNREILRSNGSMAKVMKFWDSFENEAHTILQAGSNSTATYEGKNYAFNEGRNAFTGFFDYIPEWALSADDIIYSWKDGQIYKHDVNGSNYCTFYGTAYNASITVVFNPNVGQKKSWNSIAEVASDTWIVPLAYSDVLTYAGQTQETNLVEQEFVKLEQMPSTSWKRDIHSPGGKWNGQFMKGNYLVVKFQKTNAQNQITLNSLICRYTDSPLNVT